MESTVNQSLGRTQQIECRPRFHINYINSSMVIDFVYASCEIDQNANQQITKRIGWERILFQNNFGSGLSMLTNKHCAKFDICYI